MLMLVIAGGALVAVALVVLLTSAEIIAPLAPNWTPFATTKI